MESTELMELASAGWPAIGPDGLGQLQLPGAADQPRPRCSTCGGELALGGVEPLWRWEHADGSGGHRPVPAVPPWGQPNSVVGWSRWQVLQGLVELTGPAGGLPAPREVRFVSAAGLDWVVCYVETLAQLHVWGRRYGAEPVLVEPAPITVGRRSWRLWRALLTPAPWFGWSRLELFVREELDPAELEYWHVLPCGCPAGMVAYEGHREGCVIDGG